MDSFGPNRCGKIFAEVLSHFTNYDGEVINHSHTHLSLICIENAMQVEYIL